MPAPWCDVHHLDPDGPTEPHNLLTLCRRCHSRVHDDHWQPTLRPDGSVRWTIGRLAIVTWPRAGPRT